MLYIIKGSNARFFFFSMLILLRRNQKRNPFTQMFKNVKNLQMFTNGAKLVQQSLIEVFKEMHLPYMKETI